MWPFGGRDPSALEQVGSGVQAAVEQALGAETEFHKDGGFTARDNRGSRTFNSEGNKTGETVRDCLGGTATYDSEGNLTDYKP